MLLVSLLSAAFPLAFFSGPANVADPPEPQIQWIWDAGSTGNQHVFFRKEFEIHDRAVKAKLIVACDNEWMAYVDGKLASKGSEWDQPGVEDVTDLLDKNAKKHVVAIRGKNNGGPAGLVFKLDVESAGGTKTSVVTDATWKVFNKGDRGWQGLKFNAETWRSAQKIAPLGEGPWRAMSPAVFAKAKAPKEPTATPASAIKVLPGFQVELIYSVPRATQGSWVNMCVDPKGRLYVSDQYGGLFRVTPPPIGSSGVAPLVEPVPAKIGEAQGLLWAFDSLYVVVNKGSKYESGLYRVRDRNNDDQLETVEKLRGLEGDGEHGPHAVLLHPDQKSLVVVCGNVTKMTKLAGSKVPQRWQEDHLLPRLPDGNGFMKNVGPPGGCIYRLDPDGKEWTLLSMGYRNEYDAAFNRFGELLTYDADMEWDFNTPWYRPTRVCLASSGSEYGWRNGAGKWPPYYQDSLPPLVEIGPGSPTGVVFGHEARFPAKYREAFFICDWSYGKMYAVHMQPSEGTYTATLEEFLVGTPLPLTDVVCSPVDGAMYFTIGGRKTTSALYRVTYVGKESTAVAPKPSPTPEMLLRWSLEAFHQPGADTQNCLQLAWPALGSKDRFVRFAARIALEHQLVEVWRDRAIAETEPRASLTILTALARCGKSSDQSKIFAALDRLNWATLAYDQRLEMLRVYSLTMTRLGRPPAEVQATLARKFDAVYPTNVRFENIELANLMVYLEAPSAAVKTMALLGQAPTQEEELDLARALRFSKSGWTTELRRKYFEWFHRAANFKGGHSLTGFLKLIRNDALDSLSAQEKTALASVLAAPVAPKAVEVRVKPFVKKWTLEELAPIVESKLVDRDFAKGRRMFADARCFACHRFLFEGAAAGPDLTGIAGRFNKRDLLESILDPSKSISDQYAAVAIELDDGRLIAGRVVNHSGNSMSVNTDMLNPDGNINVDSRRVERILPSKTSMMPNGLLDTLTEDEVLDLMAYLLSRGDPQSPAFRKAGGAKNDGPAAKAGKIGGAN